MLSIHPFVQNLIKENIICRPKSTLKTTKVEESTLVLIYLLILFFTKKKILSQKQENLFKD